MKNRIPRKFKEIKGEMLIPTNVSEPGDIVKVYRNEFNDLVSLNIRTGEKSQMFLSLLRNGNIFKVLEIV